MAGIIKKNKSAYGKRRKKKSKTYDAYMAAMAVPDKAAVDVDVSAVVVAAAVVVVVEVPPRSCVEIFTVLPPEDTSRPASWKTARMVQARDRQIAKEKAKRLIVEGNLTKSNAATTLANAAENKAKYQIRAVKAS